MATSGTVAQTVLDTATILEHAMRRCGLPASVQTPETVEIGKQNLYLLLINLANRGINLWCVDKVFVGLTTGKARYELPVGSLRVLNVLYSVVTRASGTDTVTAASVTTELDSSTQVARYGFKPSSPFTDTLEFEYSEDGVSWTSARSFPSQSWEQDEWYWFELDPPITATYFRVTATTALALAEFCLASAVRDLPMTQFNRDEYAQQVNKNFQQTPCTNFYFEKLVQPTLTVWPTPAGNYDHLTVWRHRFAQDVGSLTQQIEAPQQWMEAVIWLLAARLSFELPNIDPQRRSEVLNTSEKFLLEAELSESDNAPVYFVPGIGVYTA